MISRDDAVDFDAAKSRVQSVRPGVHSALVRILSGETIPTKKQTSDDIAAYRIKQKPHLNTSVDFIKNPLTGINEHRILVTSRHQGLQTILLKKDELEMCVKVYHAKYKGAGVRKLYKAICKCFCGISEREISKILSFMQKAQRVKPKFLNKAPLHPVKSSGVMHQVQVDLVDMKSYLAHFESQPFKYILVLLDVFSRFMFLRALKSKSADEVAMCLLKIFCDTGPPTRLQSDQGTEFKGAVERLMEALNVDIIHSRPYYPQSQGKVYTIAN